MKTSWIDVIKGLGLPTPLEVARGTLANNLPRPGPIKLPTIDDLITQADKALKTLTATPAAQRANPSKVFSATAPSGEQEHPDSELTETQKQHIIGLMRVNHVGEVCAQALYQAQALATDNHEKKAFFEHAAQEEADHLAWTQERLNELGGRTSLLNPVWYAGAFALGYVAGQLGDKVSLGFMSETEKQVEQHLEGHLKRLPETDLASRAIIEQMKCDEASHGQTARDHGGEELPLPVKLAMKSMAKVMTTLAEKI